MNEITNSDPYLRRLYLRYNRCLFNNELPLDVVIFWAPQGDSVGSTLDTGKLSEDGETNRLTIKIDTSISGITRFICQTVIHEMAHVKLRSNKNHYKHPHGAAWDKEIQRLTTFRVYRRLL